MARPTTHRVLRVEIAVPEAMIGRIMGSGASPGRFLEFLIDHVPLDEWLSTYGDSRPRPTTEDWMGSGPPRIPADRVKEASTEGERSTDSDVTESEFTSLRWTEDELRRFCNTLEADTSQVDGLALLAAYAKRGPSPTSSELELVCGFSDRNKWTQALRSTKNSLNGLARKMGLPQVFLRPQTVRNERVHPLDPALYDWIREWFRDPVHSVTDPLQWGIRSKRDTSTTVQDEGVKNGTW